MTNGAEIINVDAKGAPKRFAFVLLDQFTLLGYACAIECLRIANRMSDQTLYEWRVIGEGGEGVRCSAGTFGSMTI